MAVTVSDRVISMTANGDNTASAFGNGAKIHVDSIVLVAGATGGPTIVRCNGSTGPIIFSGTVPANDTVIMSFAKPQAMNSIVADTVGTNVTVRVVFA